MTDPVRVRFAPSPTGTLHLGSARTALYNYLYARKNKGKFILRLEDTDSERSKDEYTADIVAGLKWLGINWDEGPDIGGPYPPYKQTDKIDHYTHIANQLIAKGLAYHCYTSAEELTALKEEQKTGDRPPRYDNRGRHLSHAQKERYIAEGRVPSIRFIIEEPRVVAWKDLIKGDVTIDTIDLGGDLVIIKSNGIATYNFAVVLDDIDMKITQVIRGEDHVHNTAKQILIFEGLGARPPQFAHAALIFDLDRRKLSKRIHGEAVHVDRYRIDGYMPEAMVNYLAHMSWTPADGKELFSLEEACTSFDITKLSKSPAVFDIQRLNWFNSHYIRSLPIATITDRALPYLEMLNLATYSRAQLEEMVGSVRDGLTILSEILGAVRFYFAANIELPEDLKKEVLASTTAHKVLDNSLKTLSKLPFGDHKGCKSVIDNLGKELGIKGKDLYWPLRVALSGKVKGPDLGSIISILGPERVKARLESALPLC